MDCKKIQKKREDDEQMWLKIIVKHIGICECENWLYYNEGKVLKNIMLKSEISKILNIYQNV